MQNVRINVLGLTSQWNDEENGKVQIQSQIENDEDYQGLRVHANDAYSLRIKLGESVDHVENNDRAVGS